MKHTLIIGHRGTGKSSLLKRLKIYFEISSPCLFFDLDELIEKGEQKNISEIFESEGEEHFRNLEIDYFLRFLNKTKLCPTTKSPTPKLFVSLGAGFSLQRVPRELLDHLSILWLRRDSDVQGRIFLDRPRLDKTVEPLSEFQARFHDRNENYKNFSTNVWTAPEGLDHPHTMEALFFSSSNNSQTKLEMGGALTLYPHHLRNLDRLDRYLHWGLKHFELRDDLLNQAQMDCVLKSSIREKVLISIRENPTWLKTYLSKHPFDWPLELGAPPEATPAILSLHQNQGHDDLKDFFAQLTKSSEKISGSTCLKASPLIKSFRELQVGHAWHLSDPQKNVFLPRSADGRWQWYRLWMGNRLKINFFREDEGSSVDQPILFEWLCRHHNQCASPPHFAAIIGSPVRFSRSCMEHQSFFENRALGIFRIDIPLHEWTYETLDWLHRLGLRYAAITSPLKTAAARLVTELTPIAKELQSVNTLKWCDERKCWIGHNTDFKGLKSLFAKTHAEMQTNVQTETQTETQVETQTETQAVAPLKTSTVIWGGGGTLSAIRKLLPLATSYSARSGLPRSGEVEAQNPTTLIWAAGADQQKLPSHWAPRQIIDLSYHENSMARAYAMKWSARYLSGISMFKTQAAEQRIFWSPYGS